MKAARPLSLVFAILLAATPALAGNRPAPQRSGGASHGHGSSHGHRSHHRWGWGVRSWGPYWGSYWGFGYYGYPHVRVLVDGRHRNVASRRYAIVDTDISPEEAEVWLDGTYLGSADDFDGHPDFLYLKPGTYKLEFRHPGYESLAVDLDVSRGEVVGLDRKMKEQAGHGKLDAFPPVPKGMPLGRVFGKGAQPENAEAAEAAEVEEDDEEAPPVRDRVGRFDDEDRARRGAPAPPRVERIPPPRRDAPDQGRLRWKVTPPDAAIYLDDRYLGTADELDSSRGTSTRGGKRSVSVVRPGYASRTIDVEAKAGETVDVVVELEKQ